MALWGRNDNVGSGGTVTLNYSSLVVTGSGTTFGQTGAAKTGDVIRFGIRGSGGTYFGDAVIIEIESTTQLSIASTAGLSGAAIAGTSFYVSELPKYTILDSSFSNINDTSTTLKNFGITGTATTNAGVGTNIIPTVAPSTLIVGDTLLNGGNNIVISTIGAATITLGSTISSGISTNDTLTFKRFTGGYDKQVYGISTNAYSSASTSYRTEGVGWVGVTTYIDTHGNLRIKKEVLVAMSGITTGTDGILYPTNK